MYAVFADARRELGEREYSLGKHNFYVLPGEDTTWVYAIPGFRKGEHVFGGSYRYAYLAGRLAGKKAFHLGYQYVKDKRKAIDVAITSDLDEVPNECDLLKFLAYRGIFREMRIRTSKYVFKLVHKPAGGIDFTAAPKT